eukprot:COSAG01_NODE_65740_length_272_cov_0.884393_2_plen_49_part_01
MSWQCHPPSKFCIAAPATVFRTESEIDEAIKKVEVTIEQLKNCPRPKAK